MGPPKGAETNKAAPGGAVRARGARNWQRLSRLGSVEKVDERNPENPPLAAPAGRPPGTFGRLRFAGCRVSGESHRAAASRTGIDGGRAAGRAREVIHPQAIANPALTGGVWEFVCRRAAAGSLARPRDGARIPLTAGTAGRRMDFSPPRRGRRGASGCFAAAEAGPGSCGQCRAAATDFQSTAERLRA